MLYLPEDKRNFQMFKQNTRSFTGSVSDVKCSFNKSSSEWTGNATLYSQYDLNIVHDSFLYALGKWK